MVASKVDFGIQVEMEHLRLEVVSRVDYCIQAEPAETVLSFVIVSMADSGIQAEMGHPLLEVVLRLVEIWRIGSANMAWAAQTPPTAPTICAGA